MFKFTLKDIVECQLTFLQRDQQPYKRLPAELPYIAGPKSDQMYSAIEVNKI